MAEALPSSRPRLGYRLNAVGAVTILVVLFWAVIAVFGPLMTPAISRRIVPLTVNTVVGERATFRATVLNPPALLAELILIVIFMSLPVRVKPLSATWIPENDVPEGKLLYAVFCTVPGPLPKTKTLL